MSFNFHSDLCLVLIRTKRLVGLYIISANLITYFIICLFYLQRFWCFIIPCILLSVFFRADNTVFQINHIDKDYLRKTVYVLCRHKIFCYKNFSIVIVAHLSTSSWVFEAVLETLRQVWAFLGFFHALFNLFTR